MLKVIKIAETLKGTNTSLQFNDILFETYIAPNMCINMGLSQNSKNINAIYENYIYSFAKILLI